MENQPQVSKIDKNEVMKSYEQEFLKSIDKYIHGGLTDAELQGFFNQLSQYHLMTVGVPLSEAVDVTFHDFKADSLGENGASSFKKLKNKHMAGKFSKEDGIQISTSIVKKVKRSLVPAKSMLTAGIILVGHESTHNEQQYKTGNIKQKQKDGLNLTPEEIAYLDKFNSDDPTKYVGGFSSIPKVHKTIALIAGYYGRDEEVDARLGGIKFAETLFENLKNNPELENYPDVKKWIEKQKYMIGFHKGAEKIIGFGVRKANKHTEKIMDKLNIPNGELIDFAEKIHARGEVEPSCTILLKICFKNKSKEELESMLKEIEGKDIPFLKDLLTETLSVSTKTDVKENETIQKQQ